MGLVTARLAVKRSLDSEPHSVLQEASLEAPEPKAGEHPCRGGRGSGAAAALVPSPGYWLSFTTSVMTCFPEF